MAVDVHEYIEAMFGERKKGEEVCLSYPAPEGDRWLNRYYNPKKPYDDDAWTVCVSTIKRDGKPTRKRTDLLRAHVLLIDDIGTGKSSKTEEIPPVQPTAIIESSPNNYQYQYAIHPHDLTTDEKGVYEACIKALGDKGFGDPAAEGSYRMVRIPGSQHRKDRKFRARVQLWKPEKKWDLKVLIKAFGITGEDIEKHLKLPKEDLTHLPPPNVEDPVLKWGREVGVMGEVKENGFVDVECPFKLPHNADSHSPAGYSPIGYGDNKHKRVFKCFHDSCRDKTGLDFLNWVHESGGPNVGQYFVLNKEWLSQLSVKEKTDVLYNELPRVSNIDLPRRKGTKDGKPSENQWVVLPNVKHVCEKYDIRLRWNMMTREVDAFFLDPNRQALCSTPHMTYRAVVDGCTMAGMGNEKQVQGLMVEMALQDRYHPMEEWMRSVPWDGVSRYEALLKSVAVEEDSEEMWRMCLMKWCIQVVQAVCGWNEPKQIGHVLVFVGKEGLQKTRWFEHIVPREYYNESIHLSLSYNFKDSVLAATTTPIGELGEIETTFSKSETGMIKAFLTDTRDTIRPPYGPSVLKIPRCTVFCGTVNRTTFLRDTAGTRRYWPIKVLYCNTDHELNLQQLWAEFYEYWKDGAIWWLDEHEKMEHSDQVGKFSEPSAIEDLFTNYWEEGSKIPETHWVPMTITELAEALNIIDRGGNLSHLQELIVNKVGDRRSHSMGNKRKYRCWKVPDPESVKTATSQGFLT